MAQSSTLEANLDQRRSFIRKEGRMVIGVLDHMGYGNLGDAAVQESVIANIRKRLPNAQLVGFSLVPDDTLRRHGIPSYPILRWHSGLGNDENSGGARRNLKSRAKS